jgi:hypothetical protein
VFPVFQVGFVTVSEHGRMVKKCPGQESEMYSKRLRTRTKRHFVGRSCPQNGPRKFDTFGTQESQV